MSLSKETKNLDVNGRVCFGVTKGNNKINDITNKLRVLKSYRLQREILGYVVLSGTVRHDNKSFSDGVNARINRYLPHYKTVLTKNSYMNAISLCASVVKRKDFKGYKRLLKSQQHSAILNRWAIKESFFFCDDHHINT